MARNPEPADDRDELPELAATPDGTRHAGCGQPWIYCFCGIPRPNGPR